VSRSLRLLASSPQSHAQPGVTLFGFGLPLPAEAVKYAYFVEGPHLVADPSPGAWGQVFAEKTQAPCTSGEQPGKVEIGSYTEI
jgi:hypothetical protein